MTPLLLVWSNHRVDYGPLPEVAIEVPSHCKSPKLELPCALSPDP